MRHPARPKVPAPWSTSPVPRYRKASFADVRGSHYGRALPDTGELDPFVIMTSRPIPAGSAPAMYAGWSSSIHERELMKASIMPPSAQMPPPFDIPGDLPRIRPRSEKNVAHLRPEPGTVYPASALNALAVSNSLDFQPDPSLPGPVQERSRLAAGLRGLGYTSELPPWARMLYSALSLAGAGTGAYHGYKRNRGSVGWAIGWGVLGLIFPIITIPVSLAQGYAKPA